MKDSSSPRYFPAIICADFDSPIDALISLCVPQDEAMNLVAASWLGGEPSCVMATIDGGRNVAVLRTPDGQWAACNAYVEFCSSTRSEAERQLKKLLKRGRRGMVGVLNT
ncbi:MAG: hypothetical protein WCK63_07220 [Betaproteobacteria bacterium]